MVQRAHDAGADPALANGLRQIPDRQYGSAEVVIIEMSDVDQDWPGRPGLLDACVHGKPVARARPGRES